MTKNDNLNVPAAAQKLIAQALSDGPFIPQSLLADIKAVVGTEDTGEIMIRLLPVAASYSRAAMSNFMVGAVAEGSTTGNLYLGACMEFPGHALSFVTHGEQSALTAAWQAGEAGVSSIAVNAAPCGYCRQFLYEVSTARTGLDILLKAGSAPDTYTYTRAPLSHYLPEAFGPADLGVSGALMQPQSHDLQIASSEELPLAALAAANACYAPYTSNYSGVALRLENGNIYTGRYAENAAYNPSMSPLEAALSNMNMGEDPQSPYAVAEAVLVEENSAGISQRSATEAVLSSVAPGVLLGYYPATPLARMMEPSVS